MRTMKNFTLLAIFILATTTVFAQLADSSRNWGNASENLWQMEGNSLYPILNPLSHSYWWGDSFWFRLCNEDSARRNRDYLGIQFQLTPGVKPASLRAKVKADSGDVIAIHIDNEAEITTECALYKTGWNDGIYYYPSFKTFSGWHTIAMTARGKVESIALEFTTPSSIIYGNKKINLNITSIAVRKKDSTNWQEVSGFIPPSNPYAEPADMVNVTASFMEAVIDTAILSSRVQGDTRAVYALRYGGLKNCDEIVIFGPGWTENDPDQVAKGIVQWAGGKLRKDQLQPAEDWPLELVVVWPGGYNPKNLYRVRVWKINHQTNPTTVATETAKPSDFSLGQNYPNPFNPTTTIPFSLKKTGEVKLAIYNIRGQLVRMLVNDQLPAGQHQIIWDGRDATDQPVPSGVYFCRLTGNQQSLVKKMTLTK